MGRGVPFEPISQQAARPCGLGTGMGARTPGFWSRCWVTWARPCPFVLPLLPRLFRLGTGPGPVGPCPALTWALPSAMSGTTPTDLSQEQPVTASLKPVTWCTGSLLAATSRAGLCNLIPKRQLGRGERDIFSWRARQAFDPTEPFARAGKGTSRPQQRAGGTDR